MPTTWEGWQDRNARRAFPFVETCSREDDDGNKLPDDILVALRAKFSSVHGDRLCLSGLTVGPAIVTATFVITDDAGANAVPGGYVTVPRPVDFGRPYTLTAFPNTEFGGFVAFGHGVEVDAVQSFRFSTPADSMLMSSNASPYDPLPVEGLTRLRTSTVLRGLVSFRGDGDILVEPATLDMSGLDIPNASSSHDVILVRLNTDLDPTVLERYAGPCAAVPESQNCDYVPISYLNTVTPDADGNINIVVAAGAEFLLTELANGIALDYPVSMLSVCEAQASALNADGLAGRGGEDDCD